MAFHTNEVLSWVTPRRERESLAASALSTSKAFFTSEFLRRAKIVHDGAEKKKFRVNSQSTFPAQELTVLRNNSVLSWVGG